VIYRKAKVKSKKYSGRRRLAEGGKNKNWWFTQIARILADRADILSY
jgi:hypothetical protein